MKRTIITLMFLFTVCAATFAQSTDEQTLLKLDQEFITALRTNDTAALVRLTDSGYQGYNQHGQNNDRAAFLELYKTFKTSALSTHDVKVKIAGDTALVSGKQRETSTSNFGREQFLTFLHVWVKRADGWKVLVKQQAYDVAQGTITPAGWNGSSVSNNFYLVGTDTNVKHGGNASAFLQARHHENLMFGAGLGQQIKADAYRGKRVRLSGYVKGTLAYGTAFPWMRVNAEHAQGEVLSFDNMGVAFFVRPDWSSFSIVLDVPERAAVINFGFQLNGRGQVWLDDWSLEVVDKSVPATNMPPTEQVLKMMDARRLANPEQWRQMVEANQKALPGLPTAPVNLDFEK
jgi:ketosteroid isomerase-like protein